jgi:predicted dehydrogenase
VGSQPAGEQGSTPSRDVIRWGILATGWIAKQFTEDLAHVPGAEVLAVGSRSLEGAQAFAATHGIPRAYGSWQELAADADLDVIYVATPHSAHHAATRVCLEAGRAVLCEKPFTLDGAQARELVELARSRGLFLMEAMWMRTNPAIRRIISLVADGEIGEVTHISADFGLSGPVMPGHRLRAPELGGGALLDLGVYPITLAYLFLGRPAHIRAWASLFPEGTDENTGIVFGYDSGAVATLACGLRGRTAWRAVITGTKGRIEIPGPFLVPPGFTLVRGDEETWVDVPFVGNGMNHEAVEVVRCLREGLTESPLIPHAETLEIMAILDEIRAQIGVSYPA